jgi:hypothetical protein
VKRFIPKKIVPLVLMLPILFSLHGCIYLVVGGIGAFGGFAVSPDTVEGVTENDSSIVWDAAIEIVTVMGSITENYEDGGVIYADINGAKVGITIIPLSDTTIKVSVKARKAYLPKIRTAQDVYVKIMSYLSE